MEIDTPTFSFVLFTFRGERKRGRERKRKKEREKKKERKKEM